METGQPARRAHRPMDSTATPIAPAVPQRSGLVRPQNPDSNSKNSIEQLLAWKRVAHEIAQGILGAEVRKKPNAPYVQSQVTDAREAAEDAVWACYRFRCPCRTPNPESGNGLRVIDLGAGHSSSSDTLCGRVVSALKSEGLLNDSVGAGYIERHWPPTFADSGAWPLVSLRQSFLSGTLTRLVNPDRTIRQQIAGWVQNGDFGLASGDDNGHEYHRIWYEEPLSHTEIAFESGVFLLTKARARELTEPAPAPHPDSGLSPSPGGGSSSPTGGGPSPSAGRGAAPSSDADPSQTMGQGTDPQAGEKTSLSVAGTLPSETWNRFGRSVLPKLRASGDLQVNINLHVEADAAISDNLAEEIRKAINDMAISGHLHVELAHQQPEHDS